MFYSAPMRLFTIFGLGRTRHVIAVFLSNLSIDEMKQITDGKMAAAKPLYKV